MDEIVKEAHRGKEMKLLLFADDILVWKPSRKELQQIHILNDKIGKYGMKCSVEKRKTMVVTRGDREAKGDIHIKGWDIEIVDT